MLASLSDARFLRHGEMAVDLANSDPRQTAFELHEPENKAGVVIFAPALRSAWFVGKQYWVFVIGNCPTKRGGMGVNLSKLFLGTKAAGKWLLYYSGVAVNVVIIDYSVEYAKRSRPRASRPLERAPRGLARRGRAPPREGAQSLRRKRIRSGCGLPRAQGQLRERARRGSDGRRRAPPREGAQGPLRLGGGGLPRAQGQKL
jgi:hypothetical protein